MKKRIYIFIAVGIGACLVSFYLAQRLAPWLYVIDTSVRLKLDATADTKINICWDKSHSECLPLVPYSSSAKQLAQKNEMADMWLSDLPPRTEYYIALQFESGVNQATFHVLELDSSNIYMMGYGREVGAGVNKLQIDFGDFESNGITQLKGNPDYFKSNNNILT